VTSLAPPKHARRETRMAKADEEMQAPIPDNPYLAAERRADLARKQACAPAALPLAISEGSVPSATRTKGRPATYPERAALSTFWAVDQLRRISLVLAPGDLPAEERERILESLPPELRDDFRSIAVLGRHRRYRYRRYGLRVFSPEGRKELVASLKAIRDTLSRNPYTDTWSREEWRPLEYAMEVRRSLFAPSVVRKIDAATGGAGLAAPNVYFMDGPSAPTYVRSLWKCLDEWGAARHGVTLATFRSWRTKLRKDGWLSPPPDRGRAKRVRDN
jgi:hypothetical protein